MNWEKYARKKQKTGIKGKTGRRRETKREIVRK
jgi:hypothetical protein